MAAILGISAFYHDSAAAILVDGKLIAAAQEERFTRIKHTEVFPENAVRYCLEEAGLTIDELDAVVFYDKPLLKFERLLQTYYSFAPKGLVSFLKAMPVWLNEKLFLRKKIKEGLAEVGSYDKRKLKMLFTEHHLSHAASAFYPSQFEEAAILTIDGVGEWCTASIGTGKGNKIELVKEMNFPHSVGLLYSAFTYYLGFKVNSGEYKLMGLAPYGNAESEETQKFIELIKTKLIEIKEDGSIWLNQEYFNYATGLRMVKDKKWQNLFGISKREEEDELTDSYRNLAIAIQIVTEGIVLKMATEAKRVTGLNKLCMAGGVALNCVANGKLEAANIFDEIYIQPASGDCGGAAGAAMTISAMYFDEDRVINSDEDAMNGTYLGPYYSSKEIELMSLKRKAIYQKFDEFSDLNEVVATKLSDGNVIGWFQGRMEFGPRALGNRSIIADPTNVEMQSKLNLKIKHREGFRPFAPSVLEEETSEYFDLESKSPYMLLVAPVSEKYRTELPANYNSLPMMDKLKAERSKLQPITHVDFSARIQSVSKKTNPRYWNLINAFKEKSGVGMVVNTSFNVRGEPIVCTPDDAFRCFMSTELDYLVIENYVFTKTEQLDFENKEKWRIAFAKD
ncbi:MAG: carbamoyltransferase [Crocinitomicaceae bacterium]|nr:carbamoyltransferase [Crocinitomicaceae bacterium]